MIYWTEQAARRHEEAEDYIALSNSKQVASRIASLIENRVLQLNSFPMSVRPGRVYALEMDRILVLAIYYGAHRWPDVL